MYVTATNYKRICKLPQHKKVVSNVSVFILYVGKLDLKQNLQNDLPCLQVLAYQKLGAQFTRYLGLTRVVEGQDHLQHSSDLRLATPVSGL